MFPARPLLFALLGLSAACAPLPPAAPPQESAAPAEGSTAEPLALQAAAPRTYIVRRGDTLWDIAGRFLTQPWRWPELWRNNPQVRNPHLIYPGDVLELVDDGGRAVLRVARRGEQAAHPIATVPFAAIQPFLRRGAVLDEDGWGRLPYLLGAADARLLYGTGDRVYARGLAAAAEGERYQVLRPAGEYRDPDTGEALGWYALDVGDAVLERGGDPVTLKLTAMRREGRNGDRLQPTWSEDAAAGFAPQPAPPGVRGTIVAVQGGEGVSLIGQYASVVLNLGRRDGIAPGHVFAAYTAGALLTDPYSPQRRRLRGDLFPVETEYLSAGWSGEVASGPRVYLPDERVAVAMVYQSFDRVSYALVMKAVRPLRIGDRVGAP